MTIPASEQLARNLADMQRRLSALERSSQLQYSSVQLDGSPVSIVDTTRTAITAQATANGKNQVIYSPDPPSADGVTDGDLYYQTGVGGVVIGFWTWNATTATWDIRPTDSQAIANLDVGKLTTGTLAAGQRIIAGPINDTHAELTDTGFKAFSPDSDGNIQEVVRLGTEADDEFFSISNSTGETVAAIDTNGAAQFSDLSLDGDPEISEADWTGAGGRLYDILDRRPRGLIGWAAQYTSAAATSGTTEKGVFDFTVRLYANRMYRILTSPIRIDSTVTGDLAEIRLRYEAGPITSVGSTPASAPATPTVATSTVLARLQTTVGGTGATAIQGSVLSKITRETMGVTDQSKFRDYRILLSYVRAAGSGALTMVGTTGLDVIEVYIDDLGPTLEQPANAE